MEQGGRTDRESYCDARMSNSPKSTQVQSLYETVLQNNLSLLKLQEWKDNMLGSIAQEDDWPPQMDPELPLNQVYFRAGNFDVLKSSSSKAQMLHLCAMSQTTITWHNTLQVCPLIRLFPEIIHVKYTRQENGKNTVWICWHVDNHRHTSMKPSIANDILIGEWPRRFNASLY